MNRGYGGCRSHAESGWLERVPEIEAQFASFNFTNALICAVASSARRIVRTHHCRLQNSSLFAPAIGLKFVDVGGCFGGDGGRLPGRGVEISRGPGTRRH